MGLCLNLQGWRFHYLSELLSQGETTVVMKTTIPGQMFSTALCFPPCFGACLSESVWLSIFGLMQLLCPTDLTSSSSGLFWAEPFQGLCTGDAA